MFYYPTKCKDMVNTISVFSKPFCSSTKRLWVSQRSVSQLPKTEQRALSTLVILWVLGQLTLGYRFNGAFGPLGRYPFYVKTEVNSSCRKDMQWLFLMKSARISSTSGDLLITVWLTSSSDIQQLSNSQLVGTTGWGSTTIESETWVCNLGVRRICAYVPLP